MGRPIGLGSVKLSIQTLELTDFAQRYRTGLTKATCDADPHARAVSGMRRLQQDDRALWQALLLLGEPARIQAPVHYPQIAVGEISNKVISKGEIENENFAWWAAGQEVAIEPGDVGP